MTVGHLKLILHTGLVVVASWIVTNTPQIMSMVPAKLKPVVAPLLSFIAAMYFYNKQSPLKGA